MEIIQMLSGAVGVLTIPAILVFIFYIKSRNRHRERMEMIRRGMVESGYDDLSVAKPPLPGGAALVSGLIVISLGLAGLICILSLGLSGPTAVKAVLLFWDLAAIICGGALLLYYLKLAPLRDKAQKAYDLQLKALEQKVKLQGEGQKEVTGESELEV